MMVVPPILQNTDTEDAITKLVTLFHLERPLTIPNEGCLLFFQSVKNGGLIPVWEWGLCKRMILVEETTCFFSVAEIHYFFALQSFVFLVAMKIQSKF